MIALVRTAGNNRTPASIKSAVNRQITGYLFILPQLLLFFVFLLYPIIEGIRLSFFNVQLFGEKFVGFQNYITIFSDPVFIKSIFNTILFIVTIVLLTIVLALFVSATIFERSERYISLIRGAFYLPVIVGMTVLSTTWALILNPASGLVKAITNVFGLGNVNILGNSVLVMPVIIILTLTVNVGQAIVLYVAAFASISPEILEAADVDGAGRWVKFKSIIFPMSKSTTLYVVVTNIIGVLKIFVIIQLLTAGGPNNASVTLMYYLYQKAFEFNQVGQGSAVGVIMTIIALVLSITQFKIFKEE